MASSNATSPVHLRDSCKFAFASYFSLHDLHSIVTPNGKNGAKTMKLVILIATFAIANDIEEVSLTFMKEIRLC